MSIVFDNFVMKVNFTFMLYIKKLGRSGVIYMSVKCHLGTIG